MGSRPQAENEINFVVDRYPICSDLWNGRLQGARFHDGTDSHGFDPEAASLVEAECVKVVIGGRDAQGRCRLVTWIDDGKAYQLSLVQMPQVRFNSLAVAGGKWAFLVTFSRRADPAISRFISVTAGALCT